MAPMLSLAKPNSLQEYIPICAGLILARFELLAAVVLRIQIFLNVTMS